MSITRRHLVLAGAGALCTAAFVWQKQDGRWKLLARQAYRI